MASAALCARELNPLVSRTVAREALKSALELYVGYRGAKRRYTMERLEEGAGVKRRVIECAMENADSPEYRNIGIGDLLSLCAFLGQPFINQWLELSGYGSFPLMEEQPLPKVLTADSAKPTETPREKVERLQRELFKAIEELTA